MRPAAAGQRKRRVKAGLPHLHCRQSRQSSVTPSATAARSTRSSKVSSAILRSYKAADSAFKQELRSLVSLLCYFRCLFAALMRRSTMRQLFLPTPHCDECNIWLSDITIYVPSSRSITARSRRRVSRSSSMTEFPWERIDSKLTNVLFKPAKFRFCRT